MDTSGTSQDTSDHNADTHSRAVAHGSGFGQPSHNRTLGGPTPVSDAAARATTRSMARSAHSYAQAAASPAKGSGRGAGAVNTRIGTTTGKGGKPSTPPELSAPRIAGTPGSSGPRRTSFGHRSGDTPSAPSSAQPAGKDSRSSEPVSGHHEAIDEHSRTGGHGVEAKPQIAGVDAPGATLHGAGGTPSLDPDAPAFEMRGHRGEQTLAGAARVGGVRSGP
jgi:hypothetical protein